MECSPIFWGGEGLKGLRLKGFGVFGGFSNVIRVRSSGLQSF